MIEEMEEKMMIWWICDRLFEEVDGWWKIDEGKIFVKERRRWWWMMKNGVWERKKELDGRKEKENERKWEILLIY